MATNLALDNTLLDEALKIGGKATKKETATEALQEYIGRRKQARIVDLFGTINYDPKYDNKEAATAVMKVLVDTSVWSLALRRRAPAHPAVDELRRLVAHGRAAIVGPVRQELLSGIRDRATFERLRDHLERFPTSRSRLPTTSGPRPASTSVVRKGFRARTPTFSCARWPNDTDSPS